MSLYSSRRPHVAAKRIKTEIAPLSADFWEKPLTWNKLLPLSRWDLGTFCSHLAHFRRPVGCVNPVSLCWFHGRCDYCCFISVDCWNKALERFLVFTGAQRRPRQDRSSGGGDRRGPPWGSLASGPARSLRRCLWWTDGPCSSWLL